MSENSFELINEYKDQIRILRQEVAELQDAGKSKDAANKRCLQKLEHTNEDLEKANKKKELENKINKIGKDHDQKDKRKNKKIFGIDLLLGFLAGNNEIISNTYFMFSNTIYLHATNAYWSRV